MSTSSERGRGLSSSSNRAFRRTKELHQDEIDEDEDDGDAESEEETRCVCGRDELLFQVINQQVVHLLKVDFDIKIDQGLFIQCEQCSVWQHGYCVGLFTDEDVPEKYHCEVCKPESHYIFTDGNHPRTLYRVANEQRRSLLDYFALEPGRPRSRRPPSNGDMKPSRKERRHYDDVYDEQLQKALRESAIESGIDYERDGRAVRKRLKSEEASTDVATHNNAQTPRKETSNDDQEEDTKLDPEQRRRHKSKPKLPANVKATPRSKIKRVPAKAENIKPDSLASADEIINQRSKPRFVSDKASINELRKRTGAILEWLARTQLELEDDKASRMEIFNYKDNLSEDLPKNQAEYNRVIDSFDQNLEKMKHLTKKILQWEQQFGKYAPQ